MLGQAYMAEEIGVADQIAQLVAKALARDQAWHDWVLATSAVVVGAIGAFAGAFLGKKAEHAAYNQNFERQLGQIKQQTEAVEKITRRFEGELEVLKDLIATHSALGKELRDAVRDVTMAMARSLHDMTWLTWWIKTEGQVSQCRLRRIFKKTERDIPHHVWSYRNSRGHRKDISRQGSRYCQ